MVACLLLSIGLLLCGAAAAGLLAMNRAERRARRSLYLTLGLDEDLAATLLERRGPASTHLAGIRKAEVSATAKADEQRGRAANAPVPPEPPVRMLGTGAVQGDRPRKS
jgi:hypothetical protein